VEVTYAGLMRQLNFQMAIWTCVKFVLQSHSRPVRNFPSSQACEQCPDALVLMMNYENLPNCSCFAIFFEIGVPAEIETMWQSVCKLFSDFSVPIEKVGSASGRSVQADRTTIARMLARNEISATGGRSLAPLKSYDWRACGHFHVDLRRLFFGFESQLCSHVQFVIESQFFKLLKVPRARYGFIFNRPVGLNPVAYVSGMNPIETDPADRELRMAWSTSLAAGCEHQTLRDVFETNCLSGKGLSAELARSIESLVNDTGLGALQYVDEFVLWRVPKLKLIEARNLLINSGIIKSPHWVRDIMTKAKNAPFSRNS